MYLLSIIITSLLASGIDTILVVKNVTVHSDVLLESFLSEIRSSNALNGIRGENFDEYDSEKCIQSLKELSSVGNYQGAQFFDAWGNIPSGLKSRNLYDVGIFDQCVQTSVTLLNEALGKVSGQYCFAKLPLTNATLVNGEAINGDLKINIGICVPDSCSPEIINAIFKKSLQRSSNGILSDVSVSECTNGKMPRLEFIHVIGIFVFFSVAVLMVASTSYELYVNHTKKQPVPVLLAFSILTNGRKLFAIDTTKSPNAIHCLTGLRVLAMIWIIHHHTTLMKLFIPAINQGKFFTWIHNSVWLMTYVNGLISVDTFFFMAGLLVAWSGFKELDKTNGKLNVFMMYVHRYIRLTPPVAAVLLYNLSLNEMIYTGPFRERMLSRNTCDRINWLPILTYIQNYVSTTNKCLEETWYLAVDFHLYLISPLLLIMIWRNGKKFAYVLLALAITSMSYVFYAFVREGYTGVLIGTNEGEWTLTIIPTHARMVSWLVGFALGYFMHINRQKTFQIPQKIQTIAWIGSFTTLILVVFGPYFVMDGKGHSTNLIAATHESCRRFLWATAIAWITFACHFGFGGYLNLFLSHPIWQPFARLAYSMYLVHMTVMRMNSGYVRTLDYFTELNLFHCTCNAVGTSIFFAAFLNLGFESPILVLEKYIFKEKKQIAGGEKKAQ